MSSLISSIEHAFAIAAKDVVASARFVEHHVLPTLVKAEAAASTIEAVTSLINPQAANIERVGFAVLGQVIKAIQDAEAAGNSGGINLTLDATLISDVKTILPAIKASLTVASATPAAH